MIQDFVVEVRISNFWLHAVPHVLAKLADVLEQKVVDGVSEINIFDVCWGATVESLGRAGLGYSFDGLNESRGNEYSDSVKHFL